MSALIDESGNVYGKLTVISEGKRDGQGSVQWLCRCDCGTEVVVSGANLRTGNTKSCGCSRKGVPWRKRQPVALSAANALMGKYKRSATRRGYEWGLTREQFVNVTSQDCHYCGAPPMQERKYSKAGGGSYFYNGIDRFDNAVGYVPSNVVPCCKVCNMMKGTQTYDEFIQHVHRVYEMAVSI